MVYFGRGYHKCLLDGWSMLEREGVRVLLKEVKKVGNGTLHLSYGMSEVRGARIMGALE